MQEKHSQRVFRALSDPSRRKILRLLSAAELSVAEVAGHFDFSGATLSHHLGILREAELVRVRRAGQQRIYSLNTSVLEDLISFLFEFRQQKENVK